MDQRIDRRGFLRATTATLAGVGLMGGDRARADAPGAEIEERILPARAVTRGPLHHFVGYYDKSPFDATGRYLVAHRSPFADRQPEPGEAIDVGLVDLRDGDRYTPLDRTAAWSWQQGAMLQWLGSAPDREIVYNTYDESDDAYRATIRDVRTGAVRTLPRPVYALSPDGARAASLPFDRLNRLRPGYGYMAAAERHADDPAPERDGLWHVDVATGESRLIVPIAQAAAFEPLESFRGAEHWFNHALFSPGAAWITFLHRWKRPEETRWATRMFVVRPDGSDLRLAWDVGMVSHFDWRDDRTLLAWTRTPERGDGFYTHDVETGARELVGPGVLTRDGHCSYAPDRRWILNDTYPAGPQRLQTLMLYRPADGRRVDIGRFHQPAEFTGPYRCDLHPRWDRAGTRACIDSTHEHMQRQVYVLDVSSVTGA